VYVLTWVSSRVRHPYAHLARRAFPPLHQRQLLLRDSLRTSDLVHVSESFSVPAARMIALSREHGLEGVVAKRLKSRDKSSRRSGAWQKLCLM
jgi:bifunctional non-homologous end joining protein LigD